MKTAIEIEKVTNGYIITNTQSNSKKIASNADGTAKMLAAEISSVFEGAKDGEVIQLEFEKQ